MSELKLLLRKLEKPKPKLRVKKRSGLKLRDSPEDGSKPVLRVKKRKAAKAANKREATRSGLLAVLGNMDRRYKIQGRIHPDYAFSKKQTKWKTIMTGLSYKDMRRFNAAWERMMRECKHHPVTEKRIVEIQSSNP